MLDELTALRAVYRVARAFRADLMLACAEGEDSPQCVVDTDRFRDLQAALDAARATNPELDTRERDD